MAVDSRPTLTTSAASSGSVVWTVMAILVAIPVALPLLVVVAALLFPTTAVWSHLMQTVLLTYTVNTLGLMLIVAVLAASMGVGAAWLTAHYRFPGSGWLGVALILPLAAPAYVVGYVYADLFDATGPVQGVLRSLAGVQLGDYYFPAIRSLGGAGIVIALVLYPYVYLLAKTSFQSQAGALYESARVLGVGRSQVFWRVAVPVARPAIIGGLALVMMETIADYGVAEHFGVPTFTTGIFRTWYAMGEHDAALKLAGCLFLLVAALVVLEQSARRGERFNPLSRNVAAAKIPLGGTAGMLAAGLCLLPVLGGFIVPVGTLLWYAIAQGDPQLGQDFYIYGLNSVSVAVVAAGVCAAVALLLNYAARLRRGRWLNLGVRLATLGYALPGMVLAVGVLLPLTYIDRALAHFLTESLGRPVGLLLTGSIFALVLVYVARFLTVAFNGTQTAMHQLHPQLDAVARTLGNTPARVLRRVHLPLLRPAVLSGLLLVFIDVMKELPATLILRPFNFETLATRVYRLASDERLSEASTAAVIIVALGLLPTIWLLFLEQKNARMSHSDR
ncbi:MAG TPA: iron ABC transporter permease [Gammaproteobacteria bacterium]|nr:iron ABC transporter permease [Gammaproteobacteria bacterium]